MQFNLLVREILKYLSGRWAGVLIDTMGTWIKNKKNRAAVSVCPRFRMLVLICDLLSAPQTDRYYKNNTDNNKQSCLTSYAPFYYPLDFSKNETIKLAVVCQAIF